MPKRKRKQIKEPFVRLTGGTMSVSGKWYPNEERDNIKVLKELFDVKQLKINL